MAGWFLHQNQIDADLKLIPVDTPLCLAFLRLAFLHFQFYSQTFHLKVQSFFL